MDKSGRYGRIMNESVKKPVVRLWEAIVTGIVLDLFLLFFLSACTRSQPVTSIALYSFCGHWICNAIILMIRALRNSRFGRDFIRFAFFVPVVLALIVWFVVVTLAERR